LAEKLAELEGMSLDEEDYESEKDAEVERFNTLAAAMMTLKLISGGKGIKDRAVPVWDLVPLLDGNDVKAVLEKLPRGPEVKEVMEAQVRGSKRRELPNSIICDKANPFAQPVRLSQLEFLIMTPGAAKHNVEVFLRDKFKDYV